MIDIKLRHLAIERNHKFIDSIKKLKRFQYRKEKIRKNE